MATKTYDHAVIYNGKFYPANTPVPVAETTEEKVDISDTETVAEEATEEKAVKQNANKRTGRKPKAANTANTAN